MSNIWFSSDLHLGHANIIKFCDRPFKDAKEMNEAILTYHNELVKPTDHWYNVGDVTMDRGTNEEPNLALISKFHGHKQLIMGNHDHFTVDIYRKYFENIMAMKILDEIIFTHIAIHPSSMSLAIANVHGHTHNYGNEPPVYGGGFDDNLKKFTWKPYVNISIERTHYRPIHLDEIKAIIRTLVEEAEHNNLLGVI